MNWIYFSHLKLIGESTRFNAFLNNGGYRKCKNAICKFQYSWTDAIKPSSHSRIKPIYKFGYTVYCNIGNIEVNVIWDLRFDEGL